MKKTFTDKGWSEYEDVFTNDKKRTAKINALIKDIDRHPFTGLGKPKKRQKHERPRHRL